METKQAAQLDAGTLVQGEQYMEFSATDERNTKMIGLLLLLAKQLEEARKDASLPIDNASINAARAYGTLIKTAAQMFPKPGDLEVQVIALAKRMGYEIEQKYVSPQPAMQQ